MSPCLVGPARHGGAHASEVAVLRFPTLVMTYKRRQDTRPEYRAARWRHRVDSVNACYPRHRARAHLISLY